MRDAVHAVVAYRLGSGCGAAISIGPTEMLAEARVRLLEFVGFFAPRAAGMFEPACGVDVVVGESDGGKIADGVFAGGSVRAARLDLDEQTVNATACVPRGLDRHEVASQISCCDTAVGGPEVGEYFVRGDVGETKLGIGQDFDVVWVDRCNQLGLKHTVHAFVRSVLVPVDVVLGKALGENGTGTGNGRRGWGHNGRIEGSTGDSQIAFGGH